MAVLYITELADDVALGLWKIEESVDELLLAHPHLEEVLSSFHNLERKRQKLAIYSLLYSMVGDTQLLLDHNAEGKPLLQGYHVSISDTQGFVAVMLSKSKNVAVDIEYYSNRVDRIAQRFIRKDETADSTEDRLIHWSAKETVFKYFSTLRLQYGQMRLSQLKPGARGCVAVENLKTNQSIMVHYCLNDQYVLTYSY